MARIMKFKPLALLFVLSLVLLLSGCKTEIHRGLNEGQANAMLATLLKRGVRAQKDNVGKNGYAVSVDSKQIVQALQILKDNNLPGESFASMGNVFSGQGMISTPLEEQSRLAYAISQEVAGTLSRIDGVLTARVHVVLASVDQATNTRTQPSAAVFLRHLPGSQVVNMVPKIKELTANSVPDLNFERVSVMLVPVRETVVVSMAEPQTMFGIIPVIPEDGFPFFLAGTFFVAAMAAVALAVWLFVFFFRQSKLLFFKPSAEGKGDG